MSLLLVRDRFRRATGNFSFSDAEVDEFIRDGQRLLDSLDDSPKTLFTSDLNLAQGDSVVAVTDNRAVQIVFRLDDVAATGTITFTGSPPLLPLPGETITIGATTYRFILPLSLPNDVLLIGLDATVVAANLTAAINKAPGEGTLYANGTGINTSVSASATDAVVTVTAKVAGTVGNTIVLTEAATNLTVSGSGTLAGGNSGELKEVDKRTFKELVASFPKLEATDVGTPIQYAIQPEGASDATTRLLLMPPADKRYTIRVAAKHFESTLTSDADTNFWTEVYPDLLVKVAKYEMAMFFDNERDAAFQLGAVRLGLQGIAFDLADQDQAEPLVIEDSSPNVVTRRRNRASTRRVAQ